MNSLSFRFLLTGILVAVIVGIPAERWANEESTERLSNWLAPQFSTTINRDRIRLDQTLKEYRMLVQMLAISDPVKKGVSRLSQTPQADNALPVQVRRPDWLPPVSTWRELLQPDLFLWVDPRKQLREFLPLSRGIDFSSVVDELQKRSARLIQPTAALYLTHVGGHPAIVASAPTSAQEGWLMAYKSIDDRLLTKVAPPSIDGISVSVLIDQEKQIIVASNQPGKIPTGVLLADLGKEWVVEGQERFDYGNTEYALSYTLLYPKQDLNDLATAVLDPQRPILWTVIILPLLILSLLALRILNRVDSATRKISTFVSNEIGGSFHEPLNDIKGDSLERMDWVVEHTIDEVKNLRRGLEESNQELQGAVEEANKANLAKDEFLASMSHELRTPLTTIIGNSELLFDQEHDPHNRELIQSIERAGQNQLHLVNDILDMSKIESGKFTIENAPYDLSVMVNGLAQMFSARAKSARLELVVNLESSEEYLLLGDGQRINQILMNLISNAIKFTESGQITLTVRRDLNRLFFIVKDTGIGMPAEVMEKLFKRFEQADGSISRRFGGSGLGLFISLNLAEMMGGTIHASSEEGSGSTFELVLPYLQSDLPAAQVEAIHHVTPAPREQLIGHVLIAEDTPEMQLLERRILEDFGLTVTVANNGKEAVELASSQHFDLILMDMQMPVMDGIEATSTLRRQGNRVPIVPLTANVMQKHRDAFYQAGCDGFLTKPINREELKNVLRHCIRKKNGAQIELHQTSSTSEHEDEVDDELMTIFFQSAANNKKKILAALSAQDWKTLRESAHGIKGSGTSFGFPQLTQMGAAICDAIDQSDHDAAQAVATDLVMELGTVLP